MNKLRYLVFRLISLLCVCCIWVMPVLASDKDDTRITIVTIQNGQPLETHIVNRITVTHKKRHVNFVPKHEITLKDIASGTLTDKDVRIMKNKHVEIRTMKDLYTLFEDESIVIECFSVKKNGKPKDAIKTEMTWQEWRQLLEIDNVE